MLNIDPAKLAALRMALQNTTVFPRVKPATAPAVSTGKTEAKIRNIPRANRKEPAEYKAKTESHAEKSSRKAAQRANLEALAKRAQKIRPVPDKPLNAAHLEQSLPPAMHPAEPQYESLATARRKAKAQADEMLRRAAEQEAAKKTTPEHTDILVQIAGYDPNEVQGVNDVVFRPKGGGRPDKSGRRHTVLNRVEHLEQMQATYYGRQRIAETQDAIADSIREVVGKTGIDFDIHYVHRPVGESVPQLTEREQHNQQFPDAPITDDDVRREFGIPTMQDELETTMALPIGNTFGYGAHL